MQNLYTCFTPTNTQCHNTRKHLCRTQNNDTQLNKLAHLICAGKAPTNDQALKPYNKIFTELTLSDGALIMKGQQIILPPQLYADAIHLAHQGGHPGQSQVSRRIRSHFWFPKMEQIITTELQTCHQCQLYTQ